MDREQAIKILDGIEEVHGVLPEDGNEVEEALNMAIKALQEQADRNEFYNWDAPIRHKADGEYILKSEAIRVASGYCHPSNIAKELEKLPSVAIPNKTEPKQALYEIRETIDDWWDKRIITNHTVYKMLRKLVEEKMYRD